MDLVVTIGVALLLVYLPLSLFWYAWRSTGPALRGETARNWLLWLLAYLVLPPVGWYRAYRLSIPASGARRRWTWAAAHAFLLYFLVSDALISPLMLDGLWVLIVPILMIWLAMPLATVVAATLRRQASVPPPASHDARQSQQRLM